MLSQNTWFIIDTNYDINNYLNEENTKEIKFNDSFFIAKKNLYFNKIAKIIKNNKLEESISHLINNEFEKIIKKENNFINEIDLNISKKIQNFKNVYRRFPKKYITIILNLLMKANQMTIIFPKVNIFLSF